MRFLCAAFCAAFLSSTAHAAVQHEGKDWRNCSQDAQCVLVDGPCFPTSVNVAVKDVATAYYKQQAQSAKCVPRFWQPKEVIAQCRLGGCSTAAKAAKSNTKK